MSKKALKLSLDVVDSRDLSRLFSLHPRTCIRKLRAAGVPELRFGKTPRWLLKDVERYMVASRGAS